MSAYVISDVERVIDPELLQTYRRLAAPAVEKFTGRYVVRGGEIESVEGSWHPKSLVILEFPSMAKARAWYASPDYAEALDLGRRIFVRRLIFVDAL